MKASPTEKNNPVKDHDLMEKIGIDYKGPFRRKIGAQIQWFHAVPRLCKWIHVCALYEE